MTKDLAEVRKVAIELGYLSQDGTPGPKARDLGWADAGGWTRSSRDLAIKAGYLNANGGPGPRLEGPTDRDVLCLTTTPPERLAELRAQGYRPIFDDPFGLEGDPVGRIQVNPETGMREYIPGRASYVVAAASSTSGSPPSVIEPPPAWTRISGMELDRYATNPLVDFYRAAMPGAEFVGPTPTMFLHGDYPVVTSSGVPVAILRWVPWWARHEAALTTSQSRLYALIEEADTGSFNLLTELGRKGWDDYRSRVETWVQTMPPQPEPAPEDIAALYPSGPADTA
jgi:hypothetical protein